MASLVYISPAWLVFILLPFSNHPLFSETPLLSQIEKNFWKIFLAKRYFLLWLRIFFQKTFDFLRFCYNIPLQNKTRVCSSSLWTLKSFNFLWLQNIGSFLIFKNIYYDNNNSSNYNIFIIMMINYKYWFYYRSRRRL